LENAKEAIKEFEKEYRQDMEDMARQEHEEEIFRRGELPGRFTARKLFGWSDKRYDQEYWGRLGKIGKELEMMEEQETQEKRNNEDDLRGRRNQEGKLRDTRVDGRRRR